MIFPRPCRERHRRDSPCLDVPGKVHDPRESERTMAIVVLAAIGCFALFAAHVVYVCVRAALAEGAE